MLTFVNSKNTTRWLANISQAKHIFQKIKSYEISSTDIYVGADLEFIICIFSCCIPLDHEIYTKYKKPQNIINLIKVISSYNITLTHLMHAIVCAQASTCATSLMRVTNSMCYFCLWQLLSGTLEWRKWKNKNIKLKGWSFFFNLC